MRKDSKLKKCCLNFHIVFAEKQLKKQLKFEFRKWSYYFAALNNFFRGTGAPQRAFFSGIDIKLKKREFQQESLKKNENMDISRLQTAPQRSRIIGF